MAHPQVADGRDSLQLWTIALNILNKQSLTTDGLEIENWGYNSSPIKK
jgi:hypothetical protein